MIDLLAAILCVLKTAAAGVLWALMSAVNLVVKGVGESFDFFLDLLPDMPPASAPVDSDVLAVVNYFVPVGGIAAAFTAALALWGGFMLLRVPLRWLKVV